ncbi:MAG TPA: hypothetical protein PK170_04385 [Anaerolineae bacterium]|nr:hypothetical protein [Anaerolineae bacterium]
MSPMAFTEDILVQQTTADYLHEQLGWRSVYAFHEDFGPDSLLGRASDREVGLTRILRAKLVELNPGLPVSHYSPQEVQSRAEEVYRHVFRVYPRLPSPYYETRLAA